VIERDDGRLPRLRRGGRLLRALAGLAVRARWHCVRCLRGRVRSVVRWARRRDARERQRVERSPSVHRCERPSAILDAAVLGHRPYMVVGPFGKRAPCELAHPGSGGVMPRLGADARHTNPRKVYGIASCARTAREQPHGARAA